jgi:O-antigen/teichoic acid export membrane protein
MRKPMVRRIVAGTGSNAYAQATTIVIQLLSLPLFLSRWDVATYGQWLVVSAIPAYLGMTDVGMVTAAGNRMTMLIGEGDLPRAVQVFQAALVFVLGVCAVVTVLVLAAAALWPISGATAAQEKTAVVLLSLGVVATLIGGLPEAVYRATHRYALGSALSNTARIAEWLGSLAGLWWSGEFAAVALGALLPRLGFTIWMMRHAARTTPDVRWGFGQATLAEIRRCAGPAVSFMAFPAANALSFQGMTLVAATVLGPAATVVFNTYRTMTRVTVQATGIFSHALWPEFSRIFGQGDLKALSVLYHRSKWLGAAFAVAASAVVYLAAPSVLRVWSKGQIAFDAPLMLAAMVYAAAAGAWHVPRILLLSTNEHSALAWPYLAACAACLPLAIWLAHAAGVIGLVAAMLALELAMWAYCSWLAHRLLMPTLPAKTIGAAT